MIDVIARRMPRAFLFLIFNASLVLFLALFVIEPLMSRFAGQSDVILERVAQLSHFQAIVRNAKTLMDKTPQTGDPFLSGREERVVSADLQADLRSMISAEGVRFLSIRGLPRSPSQQLQTVAVSLEFEGSLPMVRNVIQKIESQTPFLFVMSAVLRSTSAPNENLIQAELTIQGAMNDQRSPLGDAEALPR
jgi:hypothetical protein